MQLAYVSASRSKDNKLVFSARRTYRLSSAYCYRRGTVRSLRVQCTSEILEIVLWYFCGLGARRRDTG